MGTLNTLWKKRLTNYLKELGKYGKLIFNDHLSIILFVLFGFGAMAYQDLLTRVSTLLPGQEAVPIIILSLFLLSLAFMIGEPLWLTKRADISYLFPKGHEFDWYWLKGSIIGDIMPMIFIIVVGILIYPFIVNVTFWTMSSMWLFLFWLILARCISRLIYYLGIYQTSFSKFMRSRFIHVLWFVILMACLFLLPLTIGNSIVGFVFLGLSVWIFWQMRQRKQFAIDFKYVVKKEEQRQANFHRFLSLFVDVPIIKPEIKRQQFLDRLFLSLPQLNRNRYGFLFIRQLFRNSLYRSVWVKVTLFMALLIFVMEIPWLIGTAGIIGMFMTIIQLLPLLNSYDQHPFQQIYSNDHDNKLKAFQQSIAIIFLIQLFLFFTSAFLKSGLQFWLIIILLVWSIVLLGIVYVYVPWWSRRDMNHRRK